MATIKVNKLWSSYKTLIKKYVNDRYTVSVDELYLNYFKTVFITLFAHVDVAFKQ